jgi:hypothetical protein
VTLKLFDILTIIALRDLKFYTLAII